MATYAEITDPITNPSALTFALLGGVRTPGILTIGGSSGSPRKWDERGGYGLTGSTLVFTGKGLAPFDMQIELYDAQDWIDWRAFFPTLALRTQQRDKPRDIQHPFLRDFGVTKCVVKDMAWPKGREDGVYEVLISCQAFRAPKFSLSKPDSAQATPVDPVEQQIAAKAAELQALNDKLAAP